MADREGSSLFGRLARHFGHHREEHHDDEEGDEHEPPLHRRTSAAANALDLAHPSQQEKLARAPPAPRVPAQDDAPPPYSTEAANTARMTGWQQQQQQQQPHAYQPQQPQSYYNGQPYNPAAPPPPRITSQAQNAGAQLGMFGAMATHGGVGAGIVDGGIIGNVVGQRVDQARSHAYWRQREAAYLAGDQSAVGNPGVPMTRREERREDRRRRRWERRRSWGM